MHIGTLIAVTDLARAREFYEERLGLAGSPTPSGWQLTGAEGTVIYLLPDVPDAGSANWPVASFLVDDARATVRSLRARKVPFLGQNDLPFDLDEDGIFVSDEMSVAWLRDPDGSVLTVFQRH